MVWPIIFEKILKSKHFYVNNYGNYKKKDLALNIWLRDLKKNTVHTKYMFWLYKFMTWQKVASMNMQPPFPSHLSRTAYQVVHKSRKSPSIKSAKTHLSTLPTKFILSTTLWLMKSIVLAEISCFFFYFQAYRCYPAVSSPSSGRCHSCSPIYPFILIFHLSRPSFYHYYATHSNLPVSSLMWNVFRISLCWSLSVITLLGHLWPKYSTPSMSYK